MKKRAIIIIVVLFVFPTLALPLGNLDTAVIKEETDFFIAQESIEPPEGIVSWWPGDENDYDYVGDNHGTSDGDVTYAPGMVNEAFSFDGDGDCVWTAATGIGNLNELSIEAWVKHNNPIQSDEFCRYVTITGEKAVIRQSGPDLEFYMTFLGDIVFQQSNDLVIPDAGYYPFTGDPINPDYFSFMLIEGLQGGEDLHFLAEFSNGDSDFMVWPADWDLSECSYENNIAGTQLASASVPEEGTIWIPEDCDSVIVGCFDFSQEIGTWTLTAQEKRIERAWSPYIWDPQIFHHVAATYDGYYMRLYMDGVIVDGTGIQGTPALGIGFEISSWGEGIDGLIDEVSIYNRALTDEEILSIYNAGSAGKIRPVDDYYLYSRFYPEAENLAGVGGWIEDYGDPNIWGDEIQYLYCLSDMTGYKIKVWLTDYEDDHPGEDTLSPGWIEPHQYPDNPDAPGPVEPRHFEIVSHVYLSYNGIDYTMGAGWHSDEFHVDERGIFLGAWPYGIFRWDHDWNDPDGDGEMNYPPEQIAYPPEIPEDPNMGRTESLAYNPDDNIWYAGARCLGWEYRDIYQLVDTNQDGSFLDEQWTIAFSYPTLNPDNPGEHHDGMDYAAGCLWISDMYSDRIAQYECVEGIWVEKNILEYTAAAFVEGMGFGPNDHFWASSLRYTYGQEPHIYEFGGGVLQEELAAPVYVDIKPASWPNPINTRDRGVLPVAICSTADFDVFSIDPATVALGSYDSDEVVYPLRWSYEDVATPYLGEPGGGHALDGDGYIDLVLHFDIREVIETLNLALNAGEVIPLIVTGAPISPLGAHIRGLDYVWILDQQGIYAPPEFLRFIPGGLDALVDGYADLSSGTMIITPYNIAYPELLDSDEFQLDYTLRNGYGFTVINCDKYPLSITEFRQALSYALDKYATSVDLFSGNAAPGDSFVPLINPLCAEESLPMNYYDANIVLGNQLLDDSGFLDTDFDGYREAPDGTDFNIVVECTAGSIISEGVGNEVTEALLNLGVEAISYPHAYGEWLPRLQNHEDYDMMIMGNNFDFDIRTIAELYLSSDFGVFGKNYPNFINGEYDYWFEQLQNAEEYEDIQQAAFELQMIVAYECPIIICYEYFEFSAARRPLENFQVSSLQGATNYETFTNLEGIYPDFETVTSTVSWPGTLNPFRAAWWYGMDSPTRAQFNPLTLVYESLARVDIGGNLVPQLAKTWTIGYDSEGQFVDVVLNKEILWHDGKPFSVGDIAFTMTYIQDHPFGPFAETCSHIVGIEAINDKQVRIHLDHPSYWSVEAILQVPILPEHVWADIDNPYIDGDILAIGTGPFALNEYIGNTIFGDINLDLAGFQMVSISHPESATVWIPEEGDYLIGVDYWSGDLPLDYSITITYDGHEEVITGYMSWEDIISPGYLPSSADEIEKLHYIWLPAGVEATFVVDWNTGADLDIYLWSPSSIVSEQIDEIVLQRWPATINMEVAYSIGHFYPAPAPYAYEPYHVLQKGTMLTIGWGRSFYDTTAEAAEQILRDLVAAETTTITLNGKALSGVDSGYLWEYLSVEYDSISGQYRAYVPYRYYLKAQPAGEYELHWRLEDPTFGVFETTGTVVWLK